MSEATFSPRWAGFDPHIAQAYGPAVAASRVSASPCPNQYFRGLVVIQSSPTHASPEIAQLQ
jgi:hypothetical protein